MSQRSYLSIAIVAKPFAEQANDMPGYPLRL
jgi:hypothetical protein